MGIDLHDDFTDAAMIARDLQVLAHELERFQAWVRALCDAGMKARIAHTLTMQAGADGQDALNVGDRFEHQLGPLHAELQMGRFNAADAYKILRDQVIEPVRSQRAQARPATNGLAVAS